MQRTLDSTLMRADAAGSGLAMILIWFRRARTRRRFQQLDQRDLADVGCTEAERQRECGKWFWQA